MTDQPLVSVGIPTYNRPEGLRRTLECVIRQTYPHLEIIVSDNCSPTREVEAVVREFMATDDRIRYLRQEKNVGQFFNFKAVFDAAQGDYFAWAADDDDRSPEFIASCLQAFQKSDQLVIVNSYSELVDPKTGKMLKVDRGCTTLGLPATTRYQRYLSSIFTEQAAIGDLIYGVMKRSALEKAMSAILVLPWDHILLARLALMGEFNTIPEPLMRSRPGGMSRSNKSAARALLLEGTLAERSPWWARELWLQGTIQHAALSPIEKAQLSLWSYSYYLSSFGLRYASKDWLPFPYKVYRALRYGEPIKS
jgi:glycosyltransferase involved in cell wall biosynthesis